MIARLRARHLRLVTTMCVIAAGGLAAGLLTRRAPTTMSDLPEVMRETRAPAATRLVWERAELWDGRELRTRLSRGDGLVRLELVPEPGSTWGPGAPDVLLYASAGPVSEPGPHARLPEDALLLGAFPGDEPRAYTLPPSLADGGWLVLYSLARHELLDRARLPDAATGRKVDEGAVR